MRNVLLVVEYDGSGFHGWQKQPGKRTVQGELEAALSKVCCEEISLNGASRTDAGVHALGQAASFTGGFRIPAERIPMAARGGVPDIRILSAREMPEGFHARFDSVGKTYRYRIREGVDGDVFARNYSYRLNDPLNTFNMKEASKQLIGTHDFNAFRSAGGAPVESAVRTVYDIAIAEEETLDALGRPAKEVSLFVTGNGFLYNMVRIIAGTLVEVGTGVRAPGDIPVILDSGDRRLAGHKAPAAGLYLERVYYGTKEMEDGIALARRRLGKG